MPSADLTSFEYRALAGFRHQLRKFIAFSETAARGAGLEPRQHQVLLALRGLPEGVAPSIQALAGALVLRHHTTVELVDRLEASGLVRRTRDPEDRRRSRVTITARGAELLRQLTAAHLEELRQQAPALVAALDTALRTPRPAPGRGANRRAA